ncbi:hypothetical protein BKA70DRAFT_336546 [Coprinopsis sp. MPI-PUGE-AT-0042]|nr:hypothetical protein BKA70DRAFT_336546 [Coprinopsis sp. MPI-PUGE-AT-0042]
MVMSLLLLLLASGGLLATHTLAALPVGTRVRTRFMSSSFLLSYSRLETEPNNSEPFADAGVVVTLDRQLGGVLGMQQSPAANLLPCSSRKEVQLLSTLLLLSLPLSPVTRGTTTSFH